VGSKIALLSRKRRSSLHMPKCFSSLGIQKRTHIFIVAHITPYAKCLSFKKVELNKNIKMQRTSHYGGTMLGERNTKQSWRARGSGVDRGHRSTFRCHSGKRQGKNATVEPESNHHNFWHQHGHHERTTTATEVKKAVSMKTYGNKKIIRIKNS